MGLPATLAKEVRRWGPRSLPPSPTTAPAAAWLQPEVAGGTGFGPAVVLLEQIPPRLAQIITESLTAASTVDEDTAAPGRAFERTLSGLPGLPAVAVVQ